MKINTYISSPNQVSNFVKPNNTVTNKTPPKDKNIIPTPSGNSSDTIDISNKGLMHSQKAQETVAKENIPQQNILMQDEPTGKVERASDEAMLQMYQKQADQIRESNKNGDMSELAKIMETARRIAKGDIVPRYDEQKLMEYNFELYQTVKAAAVLSKHREREIHKSLYEDEEQSTDELLQGIDAEPIENLSTESIEVSSGGEATVAEASV